MESFSWTCDTCGKIIKYQKKVIRHKKKHAEVKKYSCNKCSKAFDRNENLIRYKKFPTQNKKIRQNCNLLFATFDTITVNI